MYIFHFDAGHGWLAVKRKELKRLGLMENITHYSLQKGKTVYLEEDCDLTLFLNAKKTHGEDVLIEEIYHRNPICSYQQFTLTADDVK